MYIDIHVYIEIRMSNTKNIAKKERTWPYMFKVMLNLRKNLCMSFHSHTQ